MELLQIASKYAYVESFDGVTAKAFEFDLNVAPTLRSRALHLGWHSRNWVAFDGSDPGVLRIAADFYRGHSKLFTLKFSPNALSTGIEPAEDITPWPAFQTLEGDAPATSADYDPGRISFLSGRSGALSADSLLFPVPANLSAALGPVAVVTSPLNFPGEFDSVTIRTEGAWRPQATASPSHFLLFAAIVSKAV